MRLLLLHSDPKVEQIVRDITQPMQLEYRVATDSESARTALHVPVADVVLLSWSAAGGAQCVAEALQAYRSSDVSVILVLDKVERLSELDEQARAAIEDFLIEPLTPELLRARLELVGRRRCVNFQRKALLNALPDMMFRIHRDGTHLDFHAPAPEKLFVSPESIRGARIADLLPEPQARRWMVAIAQVLETGAATSLEYSLPLAGSARYYEARMVRSGPDEVVCIVSDITKRKEAEEQIRSAAQAKQAFTSRVISAQEAERQHLSRELHDGISQLLLVHRMDAEWLAKQAAPGPLRDAAENLCSSLDQTLHLVRTLAMDLRPPAIDDLGIDSALETLVGDIARRSGIHCEFEIDPKIRPRFRAVSNDAGVAIYRIVQEALANAVRHARCRNIRVALTQRANNVELQVKDDGIGIDPARIYNTSSFGLLGMRERAELVGGQVTIQSSPADGTCIRATIPYIQFSNDRH